MSQIKNTRKSLYHHINFACGNLYLLVKIKCNEIKNVYTTAISPFFTPITLSIKIPNPPPLDPNIKLRYKRYDKYLYRGLKYRYNAISKRTMPNIKNICIDLSCRKIMALVLRNTLLRRSFLLRPDFLQSKRFLLQNFL